MSARASFVLAALAFAAACGSTSEPAPSTAQAASTPVAVEPMKAPEPAAAEPAAAAVTAPAPPAWRDASGALVEPDHWLPAPARRSEPTRDPASRLALDDGCRRCHTQAAHEHLGSQHAGAWASDAFQHALRAEPRAFCQRCHAPEEDAASPVHEVSPAAASLGVGCVTCHVQPGTDVVWAAPREPAEEPSPAAGSPHPIARSALFAGPQACAGCHEFPFPEGMLREHPLAMQSTITEHARSAAADRSCADCHMPRAPDGDRTHAFPGAYDRTMLSQSLEIDATRPTPTLVRIALRPGQVGHAVPTGDLLRRLVLEVQVDGPDDAPPRFRQRRFYGRRYGPLHQPSGITVRGELGDDRIGPEGQEATFELPEALAAAPVRWRLVHQRVAQHSGNPRSARIEGEIEFASGVLSTPLAAPAEPSDPPQTSSASASDARSMMN